MSAYIPHLLTRLLSSDELDTLKAEFLRQAELASTGPATLAWLDAVVLLESHRDSSFLRRSKQTPSARRKSLSPRPPAAKVQAYADTHGLPPSASPALGLRYTR